MQIELTNGDVVLSISEGVLQMRIGDLVFQLSPEQVDELIRVLEIGKSGLQSRANLSIDSLEEWWHVAKIGPDKQIEIAALFPRYAEASQFVETRKDKGEYFYPKRGRGFKDEMKVVPV